MDRYWNAVLSQERELLRAFFAPRASIKWHCTDEHFTVEEFIQVNCEYPGNWSGGIERLEQLGGTVITVTNVFSGNMSFHAISFFCMENDRIVSLDEYWGDDGPAPAWRRDMHIGKSIS